MKENNEEIKAIRPQTAGFPLALLIKILLAVISYLVSKAVSASDRTYLTDLANELKSAQGTCNDNK